MKSFLALFTRNIGLKLLALVLALVIYYSVRESVESSRGRGYHPPSFMKGPVNAAPAPQ